jgi:hypothetical protein
VASRILTEFLQNWSFPLLTAAAVSYFPGGTGTSLSRDSLYLCELRALAGGTTVFFSKGF